MRLLYFSRDYTPHDHRFLSALARYTAYPSATGAEEPGTEENKNSTDIAGFSPFPIEKIFFLRLERRDPQTEDRPLPMGVEQLSWGSKPGLENRNLVSLRQYLRLLPPLKRIISERKPDLILAGPVQRTAFLVALSGFPRLVSMSWGYDLLIDARKNSGWHWATRFTLKHSAAMLGDCDTIRQLAVAYGIPDQRVVTFPWGVDLQHFQPSCKTERLESLDIDTNFTLLSTRSWEPLYGVELIAKAFVSVARSIPGLRLVMLGGGSLAGDLHRIFAQGGVEDRVTFPGQVGFANLPRYYQMADLYVSASHSDGSSISLLEAMACGKPALVSDIPGNREWVKPGENGWWFADGDVQMLEGAIIRAYEHRQKLPEMGGISRRVVEERANWEQNFPQLFRAFRIALNDVHPHPPGERK